MCRAGKGETQREEVWNGGKKHTWLVQTLLNVTKANVCASIVDGRSFLASTSGIATRLSNSCGMNARDSRGTAEVPVGEELMYNRVLYGEKLWRWSIRVKWWR